VVLCVLARRRLGDRLYRDEHGTVRVAVPFPAFAEYLRLGTEQIRRFGAKEPAVARGLVRLLKNVGSSTTSKDRRAATARHIRLVLDDAKRETTQPADLEGLLAEGAAALSELEGDRPQLTPGSARDLTL
jgi:uncharacterized membrane protein